MQLNEVKSDQPKAPLLSKLLYHIFLDGTIGREKIRDVSGKSVLSVSTNREIMKTKQDFVNEKRDTCLE